MISVSCDSEMKSSRLRSFAVKAMLVSVVDQGLACQSALSFPSCGSSPLPVDFEIGSHDCSDSACGREVPDSAYEGKAKSRDRTRKAALSLQLVAVCSSLE